MPNLSKNIMLAIILTIAAIAIPAATYKFLKFSSGLSSEEKAVYNFRPSALQFSPKVWEQRVYRSPLSESTLQNSKKNNELTNNAQKDAATIPVQPEVAAPTLTFILQNNATKGKNMAILNGFVVREGSSVQGWRINRIESNRVQIQGKRGSRWINMD